ncbi:MAG: glycosyltransferase [Gammaproteobacteria bacterium]|nr:glycosyltransferase [Gammaproteobacteria bacterium]
MKQNILHICRYVINSGFDYHKAINDAFPEDEYEVTTVFLRGLLTVERLKEYRGKVICWQLEQQPFRQKFFCVLRVLRLHLQKRFKISICHQYKASAIANMVTKIIRIPRVYSVIHGSTYINKKGRKFVEQQLAENVTIVSVSEATRQELLQYAPRLNPKQCVVIHQAIDVSALEQDKLTFPDACDKLQLEQNEFVFGSVGAENENLDKAHDLMINAFAKIETKAPNSKLIIIGGSVRQQALLQQVENLGLNGKIKLAGLVPKAANYMSAFDVFLLTSRNEPFGKVLLEAMVYKLPIITTTGGGISEIMGDTTKLVQPDDVNALATEMLRIYSLSDEARKELGEKIAKRLEIFNLETFQRNYLALAK